MSTDHSTKQQAAMTKEREKQIVVVLTTLDIPTSRRHAPACLSNKQQTFMECEGVRISSTAVNQRERRCSTGQGSAMMCALRPNNEELPEEYEREKKGKKKACAHLWVAGKGTITMTVLTDRVDFLGLTRRAPCLPQTARRGTGQVLANSKTGRRGNELCLAPARLKKQASEGTFLYCRNKAVCRWPHCSSSAYLGYAEKTDKHEKPAVSWKMAGVPDRRGPHAGSTWRGGALCLVPGETKEPASPKVAKQAGGDEIGIRAVRWAARARGRRVERYEFKCLPSENQ
ncbi:hypothetical protein B0T26DRAFT_679232 [Lasiosphaeria miniovina]|uniref:Uncharacterized protein n=1 Tax=Lasiosphaeria miniovina TaxID=1954250 RepID=A0AA40A5Z7_9PEZI|nr:uncharacterized protein B0T26DRAFT_679232 [Lasiosphaeria miniovina]KAK0709872.1 hypothetical protein B0T26DRAFT_679232 [Lasiosphaeria miniovina]